MVSQNASLRRNRMDPVPDPGGWFFLFPPSITLAERLESPVRDFACIRGE
jgi:hypothetical protein